MELIGQVLGVAGGLYLVAVVVGLLRQAGDYDRADNIEVGHFEKYGEVWVATEVVKRGGKVVSRNSVVSEGVCPVGEGGRRAVHS